MLAVMLRRRAPVAWLAAASVSLVLLFMALDRISLAGHALITVSCFWVTGVLIALFRALPAERRGAIGSRKRLAGALMWSFLVAAGIASFYWFLYWLPVPLPIPER